jgi:hypothetical protein
MGIHRWKRQRGIRMYSIVRLAVNKEQEYVRRVYFLSNKRELDGTAWIYIVRDENKKKEGKKKREKEDNNRLCTMVGIEQQTSEKK